MNRIGILLNFAAGFLLSPGLPALDRLRRCEAWLERASAKRRQRSAVCCDISPRKIRRRARVRRRFGPELQQTLTAEALRFTCPREITHKWLRSAGEKRATIKGQPRELRRVLVLTDAEARDGFKRLGQPQPASGAWR